MMVYVFSQWHQKQAPLLRHHQDCWLHVIRKDWTVVLVVSVRDSILANMTLFFFFSLILH